MKLRIFIILVAILLSSCNNDLDIFDNWQDNTIVYGIIDLNDSIQVVRVSKSYLGSGNAYIMAQNPDSIYYQKPINVTIEEWNNNSLVRTIALEKDSTIQRDSGVFYYQKNYYYITRQTLNPSSTYKLKIYIDNKIVSSETKLINDFALLDVPGVFSFVSLSDYFKFKIKTPPDARIFQCQFRFYYYDITQFDTILKYVDIPIGKYISNTIEGGEIITVEFLHNNFFQFINSSIKNDPNVIKRVVAKSGMRIIVYAGSNDLYAYIQVSGPNTSLSFDKPGYTNIVNGYGLFTSRYSKFDAKHTIAQRTIDSLAYGRYTKHLKFVDYATCTSTLNWDLFP